MNLCEIGSIGLIRVPIFEIKIKPNQFPCYQAYSKFKPRAFASAEPNGQHIIADAVSLA